MNGLDEVSVGIGENSKCREFRSTVLGVHVKAKAVIYAHMSCTVRSGKSQC